ncbi:tripartite tricarboxylate transporter substrate binding protein [Allopusillimonas soli]|uniref:Bug family tripartite tricarboxylate transporter substrate binding protein n=1 Tax=Allopusillimonas soli TaxID=659016 RepID=UPI00101F91BB|nr:tripartite tricarboxylate transporter substrate binding protein [Allopusillimonas soli]TEA76442.1 tripartite tricarboxylate transporter substrate binding protein [Allopusillimonas soli]
MLKRVWRLLTSCAFLGLTLSVSPTYSAEDAYPSRPVTIIVPGPPAGATDFLGRLLADKLSVILGQSVIVENKAGAAGLIGTKFVKAAPADGYTMMVGTPATHAIGPFLRKKMPYDPINDFTAISLIAKSPSFLIVKQDSAAQSLAELLESAKAHPGEVTYGTPGVGQTQHMIGLRLARQAHVDLLHIPYVGTGPGVTDLLGGRLSMLIASAGGVVPLIKDKKVRVLAISAEERSTLLPQVPTFSEQGLSDVSLESFFALFGPAGVDAVIRDKLSAAVATAMSDPEMIKTVTAAYLTPVGSSANELKSFIKSETEKYKQIIKEANISVE